jgi:hypothetical protein
MQGFKSWLNEASEVNSHMTHLSDLLFIEGIAGTKKAVDYLRDMRKIFSKSSKNVYSVKWDGCVHEDTIVLTNNGDIRIKDIVTNFDESDNLKIMGRDLESTIVYDHFVNLIGVNSTEGTKKWVEVFLENGSSLKLTEDHEVHTKTRGWVKAGALIENDDITEL